MRKFLSQRSLNKDLSAFFERAIERAYPTVLTAPNADIKLAVYQCQKLIYGDYQCPTAMQIGKKLSQNPIGIAQVQIFCQFF